MLDSSCERSITVEDAIRGRTDCVERQTGECKTAMMKHTPETEDGRV